MSHPFAGGGLSGAEHFFLVWGALASTHVFPPFGSPKYGAWAWATDATPPSFLRTCTPPRPACTKVQPRRRQSEPLHPQILPRVGASGPLCRQGRQGALLNLSGWTGCRRGVHQNSFADHASSLEAWVLAGGLQCIASPSRLFRLLRGRHNTTQPSRIQYG